MTTSILLPFMPISGEQLMPFADIVRKGHAERLWTGQSLLIDPHSSLAHAAGAGAHIPMGTSVTLMPLHHPLQTALQARSIAGLTGQPFVAGLGTGPVPFVRSLRGKRYESPLTAVREYATIVRDLLAGQIVDRVGDYYAMGGALPPLDTPNIELGLGVLRPRMAELAGECADVAITWLAPPSYLAEVIVPALARGAERADRPRPRVAAVVHVSLDAPGRDHQRIMLAATQAHLQAPHYADMLRRAGMDVDPQNPAKTVVQLLESGTVAVGGADDIIRAVAAYREAGADEVVLSTIGIQAVDGTCGALDALGTIFAAQEGVA